MHTHDSTGDCNMEPATETVTLNIATPPVTPFVDPVVEQYVEVAVPPTFEDNDDIDMKIKEYENIILAAKRHLTKLTAIKKMKTATDGRVLTKAKQFYYHDTKNNADILEDIRKRLQASGLYATKVFKKKNGDVFTKELLPYHFVKKYTDNMFTAAPPSVHEQYFARARNFFAAQLLVVLP